MAARLAVLSDIHGNRWALRAVLADLADLDVDLAIHLGDVAYGPLDPTGALALLRRAGIPSVRGNQDRELDLVETAGTGAEEVNPSLEFTRSRLGPGLCGWCASLPSVLKPAPGVLAFHASPDDDAAYLLWKVDEGDALVRRSAEEVAEALTGVRARLILCGHDHVPYDLSLPDGRRVVNPGSVGCPAYEDDAPVPHRMEAGSPHARYAVVTLEGDNVEVESRQVEYDWDRAAKEAEANGRADWATALTTGRAG